MGEKGKAMKVSARVVESGEERTTRFIIEPVPSMQEVEKPRLQVRKGAAAFPYLSSYGWDTQPQWVVPIAAHRQGEAIDLRLDPSIGALLSPGDELWVTMDAEGFAGGREERCVVANADGSVPEPGNGPGSRSRLGWLLLGLAPIAVAVIAIAATDTTSIIRVFRLLFPDEAEFSCERSQLPPDISRLSPEQIYTKAKTCYEQGDADTALPLLEQAADAGHGASALLLAQMYDPVLWGQVRTPFSAPNPAKARQWYEQARQAGEPSANDHIRDLARWEADHASR